MNPILGMLRAQPGNPQNQQNNMVNIPQKSSPAEMLASFSQFKKQMEGKDPKAMVDELRASGRMSKAQYQQLLQRAKSLQDFLR